MTAKLGTRYIVGRPTDGLTPTGGGEEIKGSAGGKEENGVRGGRQYKVFRTIALVYPRRGRLV